ncbi:hypothetical protein ACQU0X_22985 [Pseudovibrio ascidiaceicola]|uniref:hypothetical protein n=1 Tax=Pseudovibrio ascidiaceicola TaxID=285279 RepID=UPI003D35D1F9
MKPTQRGAAPASSPCPALAQTKANPVPDRIILKEKQRQKQQAFDNASEIKILKACCTYYQKLIRTHNAAEDLAKNGQIKPEHFKKSQITY